MNYDKSISTTFRFTKKIFSKRAKNKLDKRKIEKAKSVKKLDKKDQNNPITNKKDNDTTTYLSNTITIIHGNIFDLKSDAIVNAANQGCLSGGGIDGKFIQLGGDPLAKARQSLNIINGSNRCISGGAVITTSGIGIKAVAPSSAIGRNIFNAVPLFTIFKR